MTDIPDDPKIAHVMATGLPPGVSIGRDAWEDAEAERLYQEAMAVWEKVIPSLRDIKAAIGAFFNIRASGAFSSLDYIMAGRHLEDFYESIVDADDQCAELVQRYEKQELQDDLFEAASELAVERWEGDD